MPSISHSQIHSLLVSFEETKTALLLAVEALEKQQALLKIVAENGLPPTLSLVKKKRNYTKYDRIIDTIIQILSEANRDMSAYELASYMRTNFHDIYLTFKHCKVSVAHNLSSYVSREIRMANPKLKRDYLHHTIGLTKGYQNVSCTNSPQL